MYHVHWSLLPSCITQVPYSTTAAKASAFYPLVHLSWCRMSLWSINIVTQAQELPGLRRDLAQMKLESLDDVLSGEKLRYGTHCKRATNVQAEKAAAINHPVCENILKLQHQPLYLRDKLSSFFSLPQNSSKKQKKRKDNKNKSIWEVIYFYQPGPLGHSSCNFSSAPFSFLESSHLGSKISNFSNCQKNWQLLYFWKMNMVLG